MIGSPLALQNSAEHKQNLTHHRPIHNHISSVYLGLAMRVPASQPEKKTILSDDASPVQR
jgi:hypothetical protein